VVNNLVVSVVDASLLVVLASRDSRAPAVRALIRREWAASGEAIHAPALLPYEVANGLTRLVAAGRLAPERLADAWQTAMALQITFHPMENDGVRIAALRVRLGRQSAHDAAYLVLAQDLGAELWTLDGPLARNASGLGYPARLVT
jgi:predicted nucleic acid-binding protein